MRYAIIAAGEGSRLAEEGITVPKPLVRVGGEELLGRLLRVFAANDADEVVVICNEEMTDVARYLERVQRVGIGNRHVPLRFRVLSTPSSMHSLWALSPWLADGKPFVVTTVDTIFSEREFSMYVGDFQQAIQSGCEGLMGVTRTVDDEKPLWVAADAENRITGFYDEANDACQFISAGIYGLTVSSIPVLKGCIEHGKSRMRNFQRALIAAGIPLRAWTFGKVLDIDHASDVKKAEEMLTKEGQL